ncbi:MAG: glycoside hydrolase family 92 protein, partial [Ferruginibacter sp.]|nr:glycoside hydrolase family 92 protein [Ferruginibacter sp.]
GREQSDITGLIGQYAHGNEPSHHIAYLYNYTNAPWKTQEKVHQIMTQFYKNAPDGLIGNEDCGQMSAWYVMSAMGIYPLTPGSSKYTIGTPAFNEAKVNLENGKFLKFTASNLAPDNFFIERVLINKNEDSTKINDELQLEDRDIQAGGKVFFEMMPREGILEMVPDILILKSNIENPIVINPVINGGTVSFQKNKNVSITSSNKNVKIYYTTYGNEPSDKSSVYKTLLPISHSQIVKAIAYDDKGNHSFITTAVYKKMAHDWTVKLNTEYEQMYNGNGAIGLIDGIRGETDWRKGNWQGYQKKDVDVTIDLKKPTTISSVSAGFLQDTRAWIIMPKQVIVQVSDDGKEFTTVSDKKNFVPIDNLTPQLKTAEAIFPAVKTRYVRLKAIQYGKLPAWHESPGEDTHIFIDEIEIK